MNRPTPAAPACNTWRILLLHRSAWLALGLIVLHQAIVASSTYFLTRVITHFEAGGEYGTWLYLYLASMTIPYLPGCLSLYVMQRWINEAHGAVVQFFIECLRGKTEVFRNAALKERIGAALASNSLPVLRDHITFIHDLSSFTLNSVLSMLVIGLLLPPALMIGYVISLMLCTAIVLATRAVVSRASARYEGDYIRYASVLARAWENLTLGNRHNELLWQQQRRDSAAHFYGCADRLQATRQMGNIVLAAASLLPTVYLILSVTQWGQADANVIAAIIVSLTRVFLVLNSLSALVYKALDFSSVHSRLQVLLDAARSVPQEGKNGVDLGGVVHINGQAVAGIDEATRIIGAAHNGRLTITGANGSGKSTILLALKDRFKERSFLLPTQHHQLIWKADLSSMSSGERTRASIAELLQLDDVNLILLDEWDANLDASNREALNELLDQCCLDRTIVEVRH